MCTSSSSFFFLFNRTWRLIKAEKKKNPQKREKVKEKFLQDVFKEKKLDSHLQQILHNFTIFAHCCSMVRHTLGYSIKWTDTDIWCSETSSSIKHLKMHEKEVNQVKNVIRPAFAFSDILLAFVWTLGTVNCKYDSAFQNSIPSYSNLTFPLLPGVF